MTGVMAKEAVISTMGILYDAGEISTEAEDAEDTASALMGTGMATAFTPLAALAFMVFYQLYSPCVTALGTIKKETQEWKWMFFALFYTCGVAWVISLLVYQVGRMMGYA